MMSSGYLRTIHSTRRRHGASSLRCLGMRTLVQEPISILSWKPMTPAEKRRDASLRRLYGITLLQWEAIFDYQCRACAICGRTSGVVFTTDHSHRDPKIVRAILCRYCNHRVVGRHNDPDLLRRVADYLDDPPAQHVLPEGHTVPTKKRQPRKRPRSKKQ